VQTAWQFKPHRQVQGPRTERPLLRVRLADPTLLPGANRYRPLLGAPTAWCAHSRR